MVVDDDDSLDHGPCWEGACGAEGETERSDDAKKFREPHPEVFGRRTVDRAEGKGGSTES